MGAESWGRGGAMRTIIKSFGALDANRARELTALFELTPVFESPALFELIPLFDLTFSFKLTLSEPDPSLAFF